MTRSKGIIIFFVIVIILLLVAVGAIIYSKKADVSTTKLINMYRKITNGLDYSFTMEETSQDIEYKLLMSQKGDNFSIDTYLDDEHTTTLVLGSQIYYIMHDEQEYYALEENDEYIDLESDVYILENGLEEIIKNECTTGEEEINGKKYYYEEYDNENMDFILFGNINENSKVRTRFYFSGNNIAYIKNIITNDDEKEEELITAHIEYKADENIFKIPEDYAEIEE